MLFGQFLAKIEKSEKSVLRVWDKIVLYENTCGLETREETALMQKNILVYSSVLFGVWISGKTCLTSHLFLLFTIPFLCLSFSGKEKPIDLGLHLPDLYQVNMGVTQASVFSSVPREPCRASLQARRSLASTRMGASTSVRLSGSPLRPSMKSTLMMAPSATISTLRT